MKIAALQMVSGASVEGNLATARTLLACAADAGAELALLPEYFSAMGLHERDKLALAETPGKGPVQDFLARAAQDLGLWIVGGTLPLVCEDADRVRNSSLAYSPQGRCVARYDKVHLFRLEHGSEQIDESRTIEPGAAPVQFQLKDRTGHDWCLGLSVCYDLRFPEFYRLHAAAGADLLLVPAAFTWTTGSAHWELLLRARAIENQAFVLAAAQGGRHENGRRTWGQSLLIDPWGEVLAARPEGAGLVLAQADPERLAQVRRQLPALRHRVF
ncbi:MAG: carbon-nitrogen hydrolase family protein [Burkholderiaceae bacterium]|nr:carbon-nitrogen hydrolase family protein [Burkholderiaceae bacterium]